MNLSNRQYAVHRGTSEGAVRKALRSGRISLEADGLIDPKKADAQWSANTDPSKIRMKTPKKKKVPREAIEAVEETLSESSFNSKGSPEDAYQRAKTALEIIKVKIGKIELRVLKGELIEKKSAEDQVFQAARTERDAWLNWPARISAEWAAELGVEETVFYHAFYDAVRNHLFELAGKSPE
ncbi:MAG: elements of external origin [Agarilytica sp.]